MEICTDDHNDHEGAGLRPAVMEKSSNIGAAKIGRNCKDNHEYARSSEY